MGETGLLRMAIPHCQASRLLIVPGYYRVDLAGLPDLVRELDRADLVLARRWPRTDSWINRLQTRLFHRLTRWFTGVGFRDIASGVRAIRREVLEDLPLYGDLYRFLPVLAARDGYQVRELDAPQHPGDSAVRVYRPTVYVRRLLDLLGLFFLVRFQEKPLRFFGLLGFLFVLVGGLVLAVLFVQRVGGTGIADRPVLLLGVLLVVLGVQAIALGLVGEIIVHVHAARFRRYRLTRSTSP
jgi:dolichol-phosphate mannosyltransferase